MTTTRFGQGMPAAISSTPAAVPGNESLPQGVSRREFLFYIWGASMALLLAESAGVIVWFALPKFHAGEFGGLFSFDPANLPAKGAVPMPYSAGKFWLSHTNDGLLALSMVCTHLGCLFKWADANNRFECPCHGSKFYANGLKIPGNPAVVGPALRNLDRVEMKAT